MCDKLRNAFKKCLTRQTIYSERAEDKKKSASTADPADDPDFTIHKPNDMIDDDYEDDEDDEDDRSVTPNDEVAAKKARVHGAHWSCCFPVSKLRMVLHARKMWPKYVNMKEDEMLRDAKWNGKYNGKRMVFWDTTGIKLNTPSDALLQRLTYSAYYAGNVARGGIFVQMCGWLGTHELYPGAMPDSRYLNETGIFEEQAAFMAEDGGDAFINEVDRGFRSCLAAWKSGQFILQPNFMNSDGKFSTGEVLRSASIAADRSGNERAVRVTKMSAYVKRGTTAHNDVERLADVWLAFSFQANFMFRSVM